jgi:hypothetical protein
MVRMDLISTDILIVEILDNLVIFIVMMILVYKIESLEKSNDK